MQSVVYRSEEKETESKGRDRGEHEKEKERMACMRRAFEKPKADAFKGCYKTALATEVPDYTFLHLIRHFGIGSRRRQVVMGLLSEDQLGPDDFYFWGGVVF